MAIIESTLWWSWPSNAIAVILKAVMLRGVRGVTAKDKIALSWPGQEQRLLYLDVYAYESIETRLFYYLASVTLVLLLGSGL